jgi:hypothetical protein
MYLFLLLLALLPPLSCSAPGPLSADRNPDELFGPSEDNLIVVDAILIVDAPLPPVILRHTAAPGAPYEAAGTALAEALVSIHSGDQVFAYHPDPVVSGRYLPADGAPTVEPGRTYELQVDTDNGTSVRATTQTPPRMQIAEFLLAHKDLGTERHLRLFSDIGDEVYQAPENQLEHTYGEIEVRLRHDGTATSYQLAVSNLEHSSPLLFDSELFKDLLKEVKAELERQETSALLRLEDGAIFLPWAGIFYTGRYKIKLFAVDQNWFDLVRTDNLDSDRGGGQAGEGFQRPVFHIDNGIGLFASAAVDSVGFFVRPEGSPPCSGCACWGCDEGPTE